MNTNPDVDLIALIESDLGTGHKSGRWMKFRCPFPGHKHGDKDPSLRVTNGDHDRPPWWKCFGCDKSGGAVKWLMEYRGLSYADAIRDPRVPQANASRHAYEPPIQQPDTPPGSIWQVRAVQLIERAESILWSDRGHGALTWLHARGLHDDTIRGAHIGFIPVDFKNNAGVWGMPNDDPEPLYFPSGILIPGIVASKIWYLKIRPIAPRDGQRYKHVRGGRQALYLADSLVEDRPAVFCEGELDALLLLQEVRGLAVTVVTLASATGDLNLATWGLYLMRPSGFVLAHDMDAAGEKGAEKLAWLHDSRRLQIPIIQPGDKDLSDFHKSGGSLRGLIEGALQTGAKL